LAAGFAGFDRSNRDVGAAPESEIDIDIDMANSGLRAKSSKPHARSAKAKNMEFRKFGAHQAGQKLPDDARATKKLPA
jgi:hypothetical protein